MDVFQTHFKPGSRTRAGAAIRRHPASSQDTGILLPEEGLYFYSRLFYFLYRKLQLQQPKLDVWKSESPAGLRPKHPVKCSRHRVSAGSTLAGWVDRFVPPGNPLHLLWKGSPGQATRHTNSWLLSTAPRKIYGILSSFDNLSLEGILDKEKSEKNLKPWAVLTTRGLGERGLKGTAVTMRNISFICRFKVNLLLIVSDAKVEAFFHQLKTQLRQSPVAVPNWRRGL